MLSGYLSSSIFLGGRRSRAMPAGEVVFSKLLQKKGDFV
jgi:hypothetical protein